MTTDKRLSKWPRWIQAIVRGIARQVLGFDPIGMRTAFYQEVSNLNEVTFKTSVLWVAAHRAWKTFGHYTPDGPVARDDQEWLDLQSALADARDSIGTGLPVAIKQVMHAQRTVDKLYGKAPAQASQPGSP